jgi:hypothetical protein
VLRVLAAAFLLLPGVAAAQTMVATRPGLMCVSPAALATLTLPDGSNRGASSRARPEDEATKQAGQCIDIPSGARVQAQQRRINTSLVRFDPGDGARTFIVPNIDFAVERPAPSAAPATDDPIDAFFSALDQHCPGLGWEHADMRSYGPPLEEAAKALTPSQHGALSSAVGSECQDDAGLECGNTVAIRHLVQAGRLDALTHAFCTAAPATAESVRY